MSSRTLHASGGWREDDCWLVDSFAVPPKEAVAGDCVTPTLFCVPVLVPGTYDVTLVLEHVQGVSLDLLTAPPPHGLQTRQCCKIVNDYCCAFVCRSRARSTVTSKIPLPLLSSRQGISSSCYTLGWDVCLQGGRNPLAEHWYGDPLSCCSQRS
jgi:hypothetical protein